MIDRTLSHFKITAKLGEGVHFLAMELVEGEDLVGRLSRGPMRFDEALPIALQVAETHRDLRYIPVYTSIMTFLARVCRALEDGGVRYAVVGGYAVALHGAVRGTLDIDIAVQWSSRSVRRTERALTELGLVSRLPISAEDVFHFRDEYVKNRNLVAWNFYNPQNAIEQVDIVITYDLKGKRRQRVNTADGPVQILSRRDLIEMKRVSGRPQDLEDAEALERLP